MNDEYQSPQQAKRYWLFDSELRPVPSQGLINRTWYVGAPPEAVLQWVNPLIDPLANFDIAAVTDQLIAADMNTPRLIPTPNDRRLFVPDPGKQGGCWRALTYIRGRTTDEVRTVEQARSMGSLVGRFHAGLSDWRYEYRAPPRRAHDTELRMDTLRRAIERSKRRHPLATDAHQLSNEILSRWAKIGRPSHGRKRNCHGDLKVSNIRFSGSDKALALIDLDTVGMMDIDSEMGDAWRSWCCTGTEDDLTSVGFDLEIFAASAGAWLEEARFLHRDERRALVPSIERICLELAARFCADAVENSYFREDRRRFPSPGAHNLLRAEVQLLLADRAKAVQRECEDILQNHASDLA